MADYSLAADWSTTFLDTGCETSSGFIAKVGSAPSESLLQSRCQLPADTSLPLLDRSPWLEDLSCQSFSSAYILPPPSPSLHELAPPPKSLTCSAPGLGSFYGNPFTPPSSAGDWTSPARCPPEQRECVSCRMNSASLWRSEHLCYTCSLHQQEDHDAPLLKPKRRSTVTRRSRTRCSNCETENTSLWRRSAAGEPVCNACGLYYKLHQVRRPLILKREEIQTRNRKVTSKRKMK
ncbi:erythroid transcription factor isoform X1 [Nothobranchius furzeri]|uniref:Transcript variant X1 n=2 Tax=Nothobranchius furzeri TaxID=105023 RepID=A0A9D2XZC2_NOTFU|nr:transcript variant X1 [Nothobranchius furzeri]